MGNNVFVGAMADVFGDWVPDEWIDLIFEKCLKKPEHNYLFLTKNVERYSEYGVPIHQENMWYGVTITRESEMGRFNSLPAFANIYVSFEPLLEDVHPEMHNILFKQVKWIIIGAETGRQSGKVVPKFDWIKKIVLLADEYGIPVFMKESVRNQVVIDQNMRKDYPEELKNKGISKKLHTKLYGKCGTCKKEFKKNEMVTMLARRYRGMQPVQIGFMCEECFVTHCKKNGYILPEFKKAED